MLLYRSLIVQICTVFIFLILLGRLWWIQVIGGPDASNAQDIISASIRQRGSSIVIDNGRGHFFDRNQKALTGEVYYTLAVFPVQQNRRDADKYDQLVSWLRTTKQEWMNFRESLKEPVFWLQPTLTTSGVKVNKPIRLDKELANRIMKLELPDIVVVPYMDRYRSDLVASQIIGFTGQNRERVKALYEKEIAAGHMDYSSVIGVSGLEMTFDKILQQHAGDTILTAYTDSHGQLLDSNNLRLHRPNNPYFPLHIMTTIDYEIQLDIEQILDHFAIQEASVVVLDATNGDILAMANRPAFHPAHIDLEARAWINHSLKQTVPGSIFKTIVAAAVLEYGLSDEQEPFFCSGTYGRYGLDCWKKEGHGQLTMAEAYAHSCNVVFAQLMERLSTEQLKHTAKSFGLESKIGWQTLEHGEVFHQLAGEESGQLFDQATDAEDGGVRAQTAIGQHDVRMTPLQAANMMLTIANDGEMKRPRLATEIRYHNGIRMKSYPAQSVGKGISRVTAEKLKQMAHLVVEEGTGRALQQLEWEVAGKSGTAQLVDSSINEWFVGFGPYQQPQYSVAVLIHKSGESTEHTATKIFAEVIKTLDAHK